MHVGILLHHIVIHVYLIHALLHHTVIHVYIYLLYNSRADFVSALAHVLVGR
jgi:hypothetical protein